VNGIQACQGAYQIAGKVVSDTTGQDCKLGSSVGVSSGTFGLNINVFTGEFSSIAGIPKVSNIAVNAKLTAKNTITEISVSSDTDPRCNSMFEILGSKPFEKGDEWRASIRFEMTLR
jgi:hypothetical protein